jgi:hypothetical protein
VGRQPPAHCSYGWAVDSVDPQVVGKNNLLTNPYPQVEGYSYVNLSSAHQRRRALTRIRDDTLACREIRVSVSAGGTERGSDGTGLRRQQGPTPAAFTPSEAPEARADRTGSVAAAGPGVPTHAEFLLSCSRKLGNADVVDPGTRSQEHLRHLCLTCRVVRTPPHHRATPRQDKLDRVGAVCADGLDLAYE